MEALNRDGEKERTMTRPGMGWWLGQLLLTGLACFFLFFGISLLVASYGLGDPFSFIMTFFAASLMALISLVMVIGLVLRMWRVARLTQGKVDPEAGS
jgi:Zn-dependent protease with chaperone function